MPLLPAERNVFPDDLFTQGPAGRIDGRVWWVLHTKPRQEKSLAREMLQAQAQAPFYLPVAPRRSVVRGRVMYAHVPLFSGYLFLHANPDERIKALTTKRVVRSLAVVDQEKLWHDLSQVNRLVASAGPIALEQQLVSGTPVEIISGPLTGLQGTILRGASGRRFVVQVDFIQQGASVLLDDSCLAALRTVPAASGGPGKTASPRHECLASSATG